MELQDFLDHVNSGAPIEGGSPQHRFMHDAAQEAFRTTAEINTGDRSPDEVLNLMSRLTGRTVDASVTVFPPFYTEFGKNLRLGKNVFINLGCRFQDTGGHHDRRRHPDRSRQHVDDAQPPDRPRPAC